MVYLTILALALLLLALGVVYRMRTLSRRIGSFECARRSQRGWTAGIALYEADSIRWFRTISLSPWPAAVWTRAQLEVTDRTYRDPGVTGGGPEVAEVTFGGCGSPLVLVMSSSAYAGLTSWLEAAPPREHTP